MSAASNRPTAARWLVCLLTSLLLGACGGGEDTAAPDPPLSGSPPGDPSAGEAASEPAPGAAPETEDPAADGSPERPKESPEAPEVLLEPSEPFSTTTATLRAPDGTARALSVFDAPDQPRRSRGLMGREDLPDGTGMVFRFPRDSSGAFYMYRTLMPLSIAFFDAQGQVVAVLDMEPCEADEADDCELYGPGAPYRGALEVEQGYFDEVGLVEGWRVELPAGLPAPS